MKTETAKTPQSEITRRDFVQRTALATAASTMIVPRHVIGQGQTPPSEKLNIAGIGIGSKGGGDVRGVGSENIVALCDVDPDYAAKTIQGHPKAKFYTDYRELLEKEKGIDAVVIATPDHTHAAIAMAAIQCGKHVFCQKPLTHDIYQSRMLAKAARESKVCTQMGIQGHAMEGIRLVTEWVQAGAIGDVTEVDAWDHCSVYPLTNNHLGYAPQNLRRPTDQPPIPPGMNWDLWLGPAQMRPYHPNYIRTKWLAWWVFGTGMLGGRGVHTLDPVVTALKLEAPEIIDATALDVNPDTYPLAQMVTYRFAARPGMSPVKLTWYDGMQAPRPLDLEDGRTLPEDGFVLHGTKGTLVCGMYGMSPRIVPETRMKEFLTHRPPKTLPRTAHIYADWIQSCKKGAKACADFEYGAKLTEICLLGLVAARMNSRIRWDAANMRITNLDAANRYVKPVYRQGMEFVNGKTMGHCAERFEGMKHIGMALAAVMMVTMARGEPATDLLPAGQALAAWKPAKGWEEVGGAGLHPENSKKLATTPGTGVIVSAGKAGYLMTRERYRDVEAHVEFMVPKGSNSGVYFMGSYEIQILDSYGVEKPRYPGNACGGVYPEWVNKANVRGHNPRVNASTAPGEWQTFDVVFRAARFDANGKKIANARFEKVVHNGKLVHENVEILGTTRAGLPEKASGPLRLQGDHGPVAYRNIRIRPIEGK